MATKRTKARQVEITKKADDLYDAVIDYGYGFKLVATDCPIKPFPEDTEEWTDDNVIVEVKV